MKAQAAQLNVQMNQWKAQRDTLAAQEENFRRRLQEQEKARQK
jgi:hypothetical protein